MSGNGDNWPPDDLDDFFDDEGNPIPERLKELFDAAAPAGVPLQEWERIRREHKRQRAAREAERRLEGKHISEIVHLAREGDKAAQSLALRQASRFIYTGKPLPPPLNSYISASLRRRADGATWAKAFAPETEGKREKRSLLKAGTDAMIVAAVDWLADEGLSKKAPDGSPGPAFVEAGKVFCLSPSRVRERYYEHKSALDRFRKMGKSEKVRNRQTRQAGQSLPRIHKQRRRFAAMQTQPLTTADLARALGIKAESIRSHVYRHGAYYGVRPVKGPNRRLLWPADSVERLLGKGVAA